MTRTLTILLACACALLNSCAAQVPAPEAEPAPAAEEAAPVDPATLRPNAAQSNAFALELYAKLAAAPGNNFFSPWSIREAFAMTRLGAAGATASEFDRVFHFDADTPAMQGAASRDLAAAAKGGEFQLAIANRVWGKKGFAFLEVFLANLAKHYQSDIKRLDFAANPASAAATINTWVEEQTNNLIKDLIDPALLSADTRLVLTNAIYFKGSWTHPFNEERTETQPFTLADGSTVDCELMQQKQKFGYAEEKDFQALVMPYAGDRLSMVVLLPRAHDGLPALEARLSSEFIEDWTGGLRPVDVITFFPRFKAESTFRLRETMEALGLATAFTDSANFTRMSGAEPIKISEAIHKAFVDVNEEGTEAAAATAVIAIRSTAAFNPGPPPTFRADRPFLYMIRDEATGAILFIGRLATPAS